MTDVFRLVPPKIGPFLFVAVFGILVLAIAVILLLPVISSRNATITISPTELRLHSLFYSTKLALSDIVVGEVNGIDLTTTSDKRPVVRISGFGLPGLRLGWFRLSDGTKALLVVTDPKSVAYIPTNQYAILFSVAEPMKIKASLQAAQTK